MRHHFVDLTKYINFTTVVTQLSYSAHNEDTEVMKSTHNENNN